MLFYFITNHDAIVTENTHIYTHTDPHSEQNGSTAVLVQGHLPSSTTVILLKVKLVSVA